MQFDEFGPLALAAVVMTIAARFDIRYRRIPNMLCLAGFLLGVALHGWLGGWSGAGMALLSGLALLFGMFLFFAIGWLGAGDVKLLAAAGAIGGTLDTALAIAFFTVVLGALMGIGLVMLGGQLRQLGHKLKEAAMAAAIIKRLPAYQADEQMAATSLPYAIPIAAGTLLGMAYTMGIFG